MDALTLLILSCAVWYIAYAVTSTHGAFKMFERLRKLPHGGLLDCPVCLAFWVALIVVTLTLQRVDLVQVLAVAGASMLLHSACGWRFGN